MRVIPVQKDWAHTVTSVHAESDAQDEQLAAATAHARHTCSKGLSTYSRAGHSCPCRCPGWTACCGNCACVSYLFKRIEHIEQVTAVHADAQDEQFATAHLHYRATVRSHLETQNTTNIMFYGKQKMWRLTEPPPFFGMRRSRLQPYFCWQTNQICQL